MQTLRYTEDGPVGLLVLNRPEVHNALNRQMVEELTSLTAKLKVAPPRALVVTGSGDRAFMAGADIGELAERDTISGLQEVRRRQEVFEALASLPCPSIAAINGYALGGGLELALACTIRIASETARLGAPEVRLGVIPGDGGTQRLARVVGLGHALDLILTGRQISAEEAFRIGLVTRVVPPQELLSAAVKLGQEIARLSPLAVALAKASVLRGAQLGLEQGLLMEAALHAVCCASEEKKRAVADFLAKR